MKNFKRISGTWMMLFVAVTLVFSGCSSDDNERFTEVSTPTGGSEGVVDAEAHGDLAYLLDNLNGEQMLTFVDDMFATLEAGHKQGKAEQSDWDAIWAIVTNLTERLQGKQDDLNKSIIEGEDTVIDVDPAKVRSIGNLLNTAFARMGNGKGDTTNFLMGDVLPMLDYAVAADADVIRKAIDGITITGYWLSEDKCADGCTALGHLLNTGSDGTYHGIYVELDKFIENMLDEDGDVRWNKNIGDMKELVGKILDWVLYSEETPTLDKIETALKAVDTTVGLGWEARGLIGAALDLLSNFDKSTTTLFDKDNSRDELVADINGLKAFIEALKEAIKIDLDAFEDIKLYLCGEQGETTPFETELLSLIFKAVDLPDAELNPDVTFKDGKAITDDTQLIDWIRHLAGYKVEGDTKVASGVYDVTFIDGKIVAADGTNALEGLSKKLDGIMSFVLVDVDNTGETKLTNMLDDILGGNMFSIGFIQSVFESYDVDGDGELDPSLVGMMLAMPNMDADMSGVIFDVIDIIQGKSNKQDKLTMINGLIGMLDLLCNNIPQDK